MFLSYPGGRIKCITKPKQQVSAHYRDRKQISIWANLKDWVGVANACVLLEAGCRIAEADNVRDNRAAGDVVIVGADIIAKLSAETSLDRAPAASCSSHCYPPIFDS